jgi:hypothetical protein
VVDEQQHDAAGQQEEDVLREQVRGRHLARGIDPRGDDEQRQRGGDRVARVQSGPGGVDEVGEEHGEERDRVGEPHARRDRRLP